MRAWGGSKGIKKERVQGKKRLYNEKEKDGRISQGLVTDQRVEREINLLHLKAAAQDRSSSYLSCF